MAPRMLPLVLGAVAGTSGVAMFTFDIIFAVSLSRTATPVKADVVAIIASVLGGTTLCLSSILLARQIRYQNGGHIRDSGHGRRRTYILAGFAGASGILWATLSALALGMVMAKISQFPAKIFHSPTTNVITGAFIVWSITLLSQAILLSCILVIENKEFQQQIQPYQQQIQPHRSESQNHQGSEMLEHPQRLESLPSAARQEKSSTDSRTPPSSSGRSRAGSDTMTSFRSSFSQAVRPITSKTKLIQGKPRPSSLESTTGEARPSVEDGFDSWDTSTVDAQARQAVESASPTPPRFLETIPASPTTSRSPSPGCPLDLEPPKMRKRSRSFSPANSYKDLPKRLASPTESTREAHIHPLFRTDSPTPPPAATPGTIVTAAPGAGQVISDRQRLRSVKSASRVRSGSLPVTPLAHSHSMESMKYAIEQEDREQQEGERTLTPPIPDWILGAGPRSSLSTYNSKGKTQTSLGQVGELREADA